MPGMIGWAMAHLAHPSKPALLLTLYGIYSTIEPFDPPTQNTIIHVVACIVAN